MDRVESHPAEAVDSGTPRPGSVRWHSWHRAVSRLPWVFVVTGTLYGVGAQGAQDGTAADRPECAQERFQTDWRILRLGRSFVHTYASGCPLGRTGPCGRGQRIGGRGAEKDPARQRLGYYWRC